MKTRLIGLDKLKTNIADELALSDVVAAYGVDLVPAGNQMKGLCPFHTEKTPSFHVSDHKGVYHCFGCGASGDSIEFVQSISNTTFFEAVEDLAERAGIDVARYKRPLTPEEEDQERLRGECEQWLEGLPFDDSRVSNPRAAEFGIVSAGGGSIKAPGVEDYHQKGTIFPLRTPSGKLVGWKARQPDKKMFATKKDFPLFEPSLFGIQVARPYLKKEAVVVEGEWDAAVCHEHGFKNVVACGGTHLTTEQMELLRDIKVQKVVLAFDGGEAGDTARRRYAEQYWRWDVPVYVADLPNDQDPEDILKDSITGTLEFGQILTSAKSALEWLLWDRWKEYGQGGTLTQRLAFIEQIREEFGPKLRSDEEQLVLMELADWLELPDIEVLDLVRAKADALVAAESERAILARCVVDQPYFRDLRKRLTAQDFHILRHRRLWEVLGQMLGEGFEFDSATMRVIAAERGLQVDFIDGLAETASASNLVYHEDKVADLSIRRSAKDDADKFRERIADMTVDSKLIIGDLTANITSRALGGDEVRSIVEHVDEAMDTLHDRMRNPTEIHGLDIGPQFPYLMKNMQGIQNRRLLLIAAASSVGKTTLGIQMAAALALHQSVPTDFVSLEVDPTDLLYKMSAHMTGIDGAAISGGMLDDGEAKRVEQAMMRIRKSPLRIYAPDGLTPSEFQLYARESVLERRTEVFFLDYVQMVGPDAGEERQSRYEQLGTLGKACKHKISRAMDVSVVAMAQLTRQSTEKERPSKEDIADSYHLTRDSDVILILKGYGEDDPTTVDLWLDKNRQGPANLLIPLRFDPPAQTFHEHKTNRMPVYGVS